MEQNARRDEWRTQEGKLLRLVAGDITRIRADAIVNAANSGLIGGGGVDGAIHRAGGPSIMEELDRIRPLIGGRCPTGSAVATAAGALPARYVFHAVGPVYRDGTHDEAGLLAECYRTCFRLAEERQVGVISFPAISTGVYGYPLREAAAIAVAEAVEHLRRSGTGVREVIFVLFDRRAYEIYSEQLASI